MDQKQLLIGLLTAAVTALGAWLAFQGTIQEANPRQIEVLYDRIETLESRVDSDSIMEIELRREIAMLEIRIEAAASTAPRQVIDRLLGALTDYPAWCKRYDDDRDLFVMWAINDAYQYFYGISKARYLGNSDFDVWGPQLGSIYDANDRAILGDRNFRRFVERVNPAIGEPTDLLFWKFYVPLYDGVELICGIQITTEEP